MTHQTPVYTNSFFGWDCNTMTFSNQMIWGVHNWSFKKFSLKYQFPDRLPVAFVYHHHLLFGYHIHIVFDKYRLLSLNTGYSFDQPQLISFIRKHVTALASGNKDYLMFLILQKSGRCVQNIRPVVIQQILICFNRKRRG